MELTTFGSALSSKQSLTLPQAESLQHYRAPAAETKITNPVGSMPTFQNLMARIQEASLEPSEDIVPRNLDGAEFEKALLQLPTLLKQDQAKAQRLIKDLVASAKALTQDVASSLSAAPIHPYEKLIYDYLGPNFIAPTINQYTVPTDFNLIASIKELEKISKKTSEIEMSQYACMSAEAMDLSFNGTFATENLNNAFAVPITDSEGNQTFELDRERLAEHLKFAEMVKNIPTDYIVKNPMLVAKIILSEFIRIHKAEDCEISNDLTLDNQVSLQEVMKDPMKAAKQLFDNYQLLSEESNEYDFVSLFKEYEKMKEALQSAKA